MRAWVMLPVAALVLALLAAIPAAGDSSSAPLLRVQGEALTWAPAAPQDLFRLRTSAPGGHDVSNVIGASVTPTPVAGATVTYEVKEADGESGWSNAVSITYPPAEGSEQPPAPGGSEQPQEESKAPPAAGESPGAGSEAAPGAGEPAGEQLPEAVELLQAAAAAPGQEGVGRVKYRLDAATYFDRFATSQYASWVKSKISVIKGYPPFSDKYVGLFGLPLIGYHDPATEGQAPLGHAGIEAFVAEVRRDMARGYAGVFVDDANWSAGFSPSPGPRSALANLIVAIRAAEPTAVIEMNSQYHDIWPLMKAHDADVERALRAVNIVTKEFGVGPTAAINTASEYAELFRFIDALHAKGIHVTLTGDKFSNTVATMEYNLATYFLANDGGDLVNGERQTPGHWWAGFNVNLGQAVSKRERSQSGVWKRSYSGGVVYTVEPGAARQSIKLGKLMRSAQWGRVQKVTLGPGQGAVLVG